MRLSAATLTLGLFAAPVLAQRPPAVEDRPVRAGPAHALVEPHLAVHPGDARHLLGATMVALPDGRYSCLALLSRDGGDTWQTHDFGLESCADTWVAFLPGGQALFSALANDGSGLHVYRSDDGGVTWNDGFISLGRGHDHPVIAVDPGRTAAGETVYIVSALGRPGALGRRRGAVYIARSRDGARTFAEPHHVIASNLSYEAHDADVLSDGTLIVAFADHRRPGDRRRLERARDWLLVSPDGGNTFSEPLLIAETCDGTAGWSSLAVAPRGARFPDRIYHVCGGVPLPGIQVRHSDDRGETWSDPVLLGANLRVTPFAKTPVIAVNAEGLVAVAWYDGRSDPGTIKGSLRCQEMYVAISHDGARSFGEETKVSSARSCPGNPASITTALRFPFGGDYVGFAAAPDGAFRLLWSAAHDGPYRLRLATIRP